MNLTGNIVTWQIAVAAVGTIAAGLLRALIYMPACPVAEVEVELLLWPATPNSQQKRVKKAVVKQTLLFLFQHRFS